jgi:tetratricopeptide (TPR) repeat protein
MAAAEKLKDLSASDAIYRAANDQFDLSREPWRHFCVEYARLPTSVGDKTQAVHRWKAVADVRPDEPILIGLAYSLINAHQFEEAEMVARRAFALYPSGAGVHAVYARTAFRLRQWNESEKRWIKMVERFPNNATGWAGLIDILRNLRKLEKAEAEAQKAIAKFPLDFEIGCEFASCAADRLGWEEALLRWRQMLINHPPRARVHIGAAVALRELGRLDESAQLLLDAKKIFPNEAAIHVEYAQISINQGQWAEALSRIAIGLSQFPDDVQLKGRRGDALQLAALAEDRQSSQAVDSIGHRASDDPIEMTHLISQFESLGDNCEFGLVQRHYGAEPLGLLRWTAITPIKLSEGLEARFDGLWEPDNVVLSMMRGEYFLQDKKYGMHMHTFIRSDVDQTKLHAQMLRRLKFLVGKLFDDIETAEKIFVYKMRDGIISDEEINLLEKTISKFGAVKLLCVRLISTEKPNGLVERISDHLAIGYIDKLSPAASHGEIHFGSWENICINAHKIFHP